MSHPIAIDLGDVFFHIHLVLECQCTGAVPSQKTGKTTCMLSVMRSWVGMAWRLNSGILTSYMYVYAPHSCS